MLLKFCHGEVSKHITDTMYKNPGKKTQSARGRAGVSHIQGACVIGRSIFNMYHFYKINFRK